MQTVNSSETLLPRPHVILTYMTLCLLVSVKLKQKTQWMVHAEKIELQEPHYVLKQRCMM